MGAFATPGLDQVIQEVEAQLVGGQTNVPEVDPKDVLRGNKELQDIVKNLATHFVGLDKWARRQEIMDARRQRYYWRGQQYIYWKSDGVGFVPAISGQSIPLGDDTVEVPRYTDVYNLYTPYGESLLATLVENAPGVNWQPDDMSKAQDVSAAQVAEKYQQKIEKDNDRKALQSDVARFFYTDGRTVLYTRRVKNEGEDVEYPLITAHGVLETKVIPITAKCQADLVFMSVSEEKDIYQLKGEYPDYAKDIKEGGNSLGESSYERIARLGVLQGSKSLLSGGEAFAHMVTEHKVFLRPSTFDKAPKEFQEQLKQLFPNGLKAVFSGDAYCGSENISMDSQLTIGFPGSGDGMARPSMGNRLVPIQDVFNDELNLWHEAHDHCVPTLFMYSETGDIEAVREQSSDPGNIIPFTSLPPGATSAASAFFQSVLQAIPETLPKFVMFLQGPFAQFVSGAFPALFGGDTGDNDTAKGIAIQRDQAMGRMGIPWGAIQGLFAGAYYQAVMSEVQFGEEGGKFMYALKDKSGQVVKEELSVDDLKNGSFKCYADVDSGFPESTSAKKQTFQTLMTAAERNPVLASTMSEPDNMELGNELIGLPDLVIPGAEARNKQLIEINQMLTDGPPVVPDLGEIQKMAMQNPSLLQGMAEWEKLVQKTPQGQDPPPPPIPPDMMSPTVKVQHFDYNEFELQACQRWLSSPERRKADVDNPGGVQNVICHAMKHEQAIQEKMMQQAMSAGAPPASSQGAASSILNSNPAAASQQPPTAQPAQ